MQFDLCFLFGLCLVHGKIQINPGIELFVAVFLIKYHLLDQLREVATLAVLKCQLSDQF